MHERMEEGPAAVADAARATQLAAVYPLGFEPVQVDEKYPAIPPPDLEIAAFEAETEDIGAAAAAAADAGSGGLAAPAGERPAPPPAAEIFVIDPAVAVGDAGAGAPVRGRLLAQDIAEIARAREALRARDLLDGERRGADGAARAFRTDDSVPIILGCILAALLMIMVSAAAMFVSLAR